MRSLVVAVLVAGSAIITTGAAGCGKGGVAAEVSASEPAGRVVEVAGKVEATRGGATRALSAGAEVFRDDVIAAAGDGAVTIDLFHNGARWHVDGGQPRKRVDESVAWGLAKAARGETVEHATSAAGRNGERSAADTAATAPIGGTSTLEKTGTAGAKTSGSVAGNRAPGRGESRGSAAPPDRDLGAASPDVSAEAPPPPPPPPLPRDELPRPRLEEPAKIEQAKNADQDKRDGGREDLRRRPPAAEPVSRKQQLTLAELREPLRACLEAAAPKLTLVITVAGGTRSISAAGASQPVLACFTRVLAPLPPGGDGRVTLDLAR